MNIKTGKVNNEADDPLLPQVLDYLNKFDFPLAYIIQRKFKIGFSRAERILKQIEKKKSVSMSSETPKVGLNILIFKNNKVLLGLLTNKWLYQGKKVYGVPGRDLNFRETISTGVKRNLKEELDVEVINYKIISINANYEYGNHYIGIGVVADIKGYIKHLKKEDWEKWEWFDINKLPENLFPDAKNLIRCYLENKICVSE